ncbi:hypothetical protein O1611_g10112 [Lasiodiplodia mahajangana]|uniref:Uncharacterized protein n=1 Tax=Lasiodiplodia mahajangana TaxID=1108764 RepID=A0ACC2J235_9PEZI|nr:hypothetical protein O1611_g10112 [Lasiodiplodia mahajangana]
MHLDLGHPDVEAGEETAMMTMALIVNGVVALVTIAIAAVAAPARQRSPTVGDKVPLENVPGVGAICRTSPICTTSILRLAAKEQRIPSDAIGRSEPKEPLYHPGGIVVRGGNAYSNDIGDYVPVFLIVAVSNSNHRPYRNESP